VEWLWLFGPGYPVVVGEERSKPHDFANCAVMCGGLSCLAKKGVTENAKDWAFTTSVAEHREWIEAFVSMLEDEVQVKRVLDELYLEQQRSGKSLGI
jgi:hypothetical protein